MFSIKARRGNANQRLRILRLAEQNRVIISLSAALMTPNTGDILSSNVVFIFCQQVLRGGQVFPKEQHDLVSDGL